MRPWSILHSFVTALLSVAVTQPGSSAQVTASSTQPVGGGVVNGLRLQARVHPTAVVSGEPFELAVEAVNEGKEMLHLYAPRYSDLDFVVNWRLVHSDGRTFAPPWIPYQSEAEGSGRIGNVSTIRPSETSQFMRTRAQFMQPVEGEPRSFDVFGRAKALPFSDLAIPLPPGEYRVAFWYGKRNAAAIFNEEHDVQEKPIAELWTGLLKSNEVRLHVIAAPDPSIEVRSVDAQTQTFMMVIINPTQQPLRLQGAFVLTVSGKPGSHARLRFRTDPAVAAMGKDETFTLELPPRSSTERTVNLSNMPFEILARWNPQLLRVEKFKEKSGPFMEVGGSRCSVEFVGDPARRIVSQPFDLTGRRTASQPAAEAHPKVPNTQPAWGEPVNGLRLAIEPANSRLLGAGRGLLTYGVSNKDDAGRNVTPEEVELEIDGKWYSDRGGLKQQRFRANLQPYFLRHGMLIERLTIPIDVTDVGGKYPLVGPGSHRFRLRLTIEPDPQRRGHPFQISSGVVEVGTPDDATVLQNRETSRTIISSLARALAAEEAEASRPSNRRTEEIERALLRQMERDNRFGEDLLTAYGATELPMPILSLITDYAVAKAIEEELLSSLKPGNEKQARYRRFGRVSRATFDLYKKLIQEANSRGLDVFTVADVQTGLAREVVKELGIVDSPPQTQPSGSPAAGDVR